MDGMCDRVPCGCRVGARIGCRRAVVPWCPCAVSGARVGASLRGFPTVSTVFALSRHAGTVVRVSQGALNARP